MTLDVEARTDEVHRQILQLLPPDLFDFADLDAGVERVMTMLGGAPVPVPDSVATSDHPVASVDGQEIVVRTYRPVGLDGVVPALYWIHGGGLVLGNVGMDDAHCADIAERLGIVVASVDYRVAPAFPYPTPLDDCQAGLAWLFDTVGDLGVDAGRIALGGGSAGGGLAAALALRLRDAGDTRVCFQLLRYPMLDDRNDTPSSHAVVDGRVWNRGANLAGWNAYLAGRAGAADVPADAAAARATDLTGLPPAIVTVGGLDLFLDEDVAYAQALMRAGVATELHVYPEAFHGSDVMVAHADVSIRWRRDEVDALRRALARDPS